MNPEMIAKILPPNGDEICTVVTLLFASPALIVFSLLMLIIGLVRDRFAPDYCKRNGVGRVLALSAGLLGAIWCLRYAVGYFAIITGAEWQTLTKAEEVFNSAIHALQTLSMDEEYTEYIQRGKQMLGYLLGAGHWSVDAYGFYAAVLNFIAPIVGGAVIFEILANVFPRVRLFLLYLVFWREKCFFSELNADSLAMAASLRQYYPKTLKKPRPILIFTDTYVDDEKEKDYELLLSAKQMGAICVRDDLLHVSKNILGKRSYYLMDRQELSNLQTLQAFAEIARPEHLRKASIFLFVRSDLYVRVEQQIKQKLKEKIRKRVLWGEKDEATVIPVQSDRNLIHNLLSDVPLYEPLIRKKDPTELNVTIFGNGTIGTEAFLSVYWMGQMMTTTADGFMKPIKLRVDVVSKDTEEDFWSKIAYINPEIKYTRALENEPSEEEKLEQKILDNGLNGPRMPYITVHYHQKDVKSGGFLDLRKAEHSFLKETDYFIVALGSDEDNITVAERLRLGVGKSHLESLDPQNAATVGHTVITYAVFDSALCRALNEKRFFDDCVKGTPDIFMHAFGSREQVFSCENVLMSKSLVRAEEIGAAYTKAQLGETYLKDNKTRAANEDKNYTHWADIARALHIKYKVFALGILDSSLFDDVECDSAEDREINYEAAYKNHLLKVKDACARYQCVAIAVDPGCLTEEDRDLRRKVDTKAHLLAWLEHRRWCAFTRTMGYRSTEAVENNYGRFKKHKNMSLKLHPCLVETAYPETVEGRYMIAKFDHFMRPEKNSFLPENVKIRDRLDILSYKLYALKQKTVQEENKKTGIEQEKPKKSDFKEYDYYFHDFDEYWMPAEAAEALCLPEWFIRLLCRLGILKGAFRYEEKDTWFIPCETAPRWRKFAEKLPKPKEKVKKQERETHV